MEKKQGKKRKSVKRELLDLIFGDQIAKDALGKERQQLEEFALDFCINNDAVRESVPNANQAVAEGEGEDEDEEEEEEEPMQRETYQGREEEEEYDFWESLLQEVEEAPKAEVFQGSFD